MDREDLIDALSIHTFDYSTAEGGVVCECGEFAGGYLPWWEHQADAILEWHHANNQDA